MLRKLSLATALFVATAFGIATAAPIGPHQTASDGGFVIHAKKSKGTASKSSGKMAGKHRGHRHNRGAGAAGIAGGILMLLCIESGC